MSTKTPQPRTKKSVVLRLRKFTLGRYLEMGIAKARSEAAATLPRL